MLGLAPAAVVMPSAITQSGLSTFGALGLEDPGSRRLSLDLSSPHPELTPKEIAYRNSRKLFWGLFKAGITEIPEYAKRRAIEDRSTVYALDTDIASYKSYSAATKMRIQKKRNADRVLAKLAQRGFLEDEREAFIEKFGFDIW